jgi:hypothetical protein
LLPSFYTATISDNHNKIKAGVFEDSTFRRAIEGNIEQFIDVITMVYTKELKRQLGDLAKKVTVIKKEKPSRDSKTHSPGRCSQPTLTDLAAPTCLEHRHPSFNGQAEDLNEPPILGLGMLMAALFCYQFVRFTDRQRLSG